MNRAARGKQRTRQPADQSTGELTFPLTVFVSLFVCAFLWPSEGAINGDGLHLSFLWMAGLAAVFLWDSWQDSPEDSPKSTTAQSPKNRSSPISPDRLVLWGLSLLLLGIWVSTWNVFRVSGDRRAALNLAFDWTAIAVCVCLCRRLISRVECRRSITQLVAGLSIGLSVFGIWQSHVYYASEGSQYLEQRRILDEGSNPIEVARIRREFSRRQIPLDGPARRQFEQRLLASTEPFGPFALANTLAGVLAVGVVLIGSALYSGWQQRRQSLSALILPTVCFGIVVWCLILTKSRSAWAGTAVGLTLLRLTWPRSTSDSPSSSFSTPLKALGAICLAGAALFAIGLATGIVDKEVVLESPRSLQFRLFYWMGATGVIGDEPLFGAGPGNFRQLYLAHKPVESSESILDPHNLLLDAWCFAGISGFSGILLLMLGIVKALGNSRPLLSAPAAPVSVVPGLAGCLLIHFGWKWLSGEYFDAQDAGLAVAVILTGLGIRSMSHLSWNPAAPAAAACALLVHLMGAGGLQITTLGSLLVILACLAVPGPSTASASHTGRYGRLPKMLAAAGFAAMAGAVVVWGLLPVKTAGLQQAIGRDRLLAADPIAAIDAFRQGATADPLSPAMRQQIVQAETYSLMRRSRPEDGGQPAITEPEVSRIDAACDDAIRSDKRAIDGRLSRARIYQQLVRLTEDSQYIESSVRDLREVTRRHPTSAALHVELAICQQTAGDSEAAVASAERALEIESVNRSWGHSDQYLSEEELTALEQIMNGGAQ